MGDYLIITYDEQPRLNISSLCICCLEQPIFHMNLMHLIGLNLELILGCPFEKRSTRELVLVDNCGNSSGLGRACDHPRVISGEREI